MSTESIRIGRVKNTSDKDMIFMFTSFTMQGIRIPVNARDSADVDIFMDITDTLFIKMKVAQGGVLPSRTVLLTYQVQDAGNLFYYQVTEQSTEKKSVDALTTSGADIQLDLWYMGDGVVIVGTGDM